MILCKIGIRWFINWTLNFYVIP